MIKYCPTCKTEKSVSEFYKNKSRKDGLSASCNLCDKIRHHKLWSNKKIVNLKVKEDKQKVKTDKVINEYLGLEIGSYKIVEYLGYNLENQDSKYKRHYFKKECQFCGCQSTYSSTALKSQIGKNQVCNLCNESINIHTKQRKCSSCNLWLSATSDNFPLSKNKPFGVHYHCKICHNIKSRKRRESKEVRDKEYQQKKFRMENDELFKLTCNIRNLIRISIKGRGYSKKSNTYNILGCSFSEFKLHIESQFKDWMSWDNYGLYNGDLDYGWDLDHIIPVSSAVDEQGIIKLNHYTNFQPLCSYTNRYIKRHSIDWIDSNLR